jgi:hypothetical protein
MLPPNNAIEPEPHWLGPRPGWTISCAADAIADRNKPPVHSVQTTARALVVGVTGATHAVYFSNWLKGDSCCFLVASGHQLRPIRNGAVGDVVTWAHGGRFALRSADPSRRRLKLVAAFWQDVDIRCLQQGSDQRGCRLPRNGARAIANG